MINDIKDKFIGIHYIVPWITAILIINLDNNIFNQKVS